MKMPIKLLLFLVEVNINTLLTVVLGKKNQVNCCLTGDNDSSDAQPTYDLTFQSQSGIFVIACKVKYAIYLPEEQWSSGKSGAR